MVELGAAPGDQIAKLAELGYQATSVDLGESSDQWGDGTNGRMTSLLAAAGAADVTWDLEQVPYPLADSSFDAVVMTEVYEHLRDYPVRSLQEVARILRPVGRLYFTTPNAAYLVNRFRALAGKNIATSLPDWIGGVPHARHAREYLFSEVHTLMEHVGLEVVSAQSRHFHIDVGRQGATAQAVKRMLGWVAERRPTLGPQIIVVAQRPSLSPSGPHEG